MKKLLSLIACLGLLSVAACQTGSDPTNRDPGDPGSQNQRSLYRAR